MTRSLLMAVFAGVAGVSLACGSSGAGRDAAPDGSVVDAADAPDAAGDVAEDAGDVGGTMNGLQLPPGVAPPILLIGDETTLTGAGRTACSHQVPASGGGDRWCAFRRNGAVPGSTELWVMDVSVAARGATPSCDGTSTACLRLTTTLWRSYGNDFEGDSLIFYADPPPTLKTSDPYLGPVYAWRPGWSRARQLASNASLCVGHLVAPVAACVSDPTGDADNPDDAQFRVGVVADVSDSELPALPGRWPFHADGSVTSQLAFSPDGETFAVSVPAAGGVGLSLSVIPTRDVSTTTLRDHVLEGIQPWAISNDGKKIFFYRGPPTDATLSSADFPSGTGEQVLATKVLEYGMPGREASDLALLVHVKDPAAGRVVRLLRDRDHPEAAVTVFSTRGVLEGLAIARDLRYVAWIDEDLRGVVIHGQDLTTCAWNPTPAPSVSDVGFVDDSSFMYWKETRPGGLGVRDGVLARPERCSEQVRFARALTFVSPVGHRGLVYGDEHDDSERTVTLKYASLAPGRDEAAHGGVRVHEHVTAPVTLVEGAGAPTDLHVVYRAEAAPGRPAGVYMFGPVPF